MRSSARTAGTALIASAAAALALTAAPGGAAAAAGPAPAADRVHGDTTQLPGTGAVARSALRAVRAHPKAAAVSRGQGFRATDALRDPDGSTHVRVARTYRGVPVLGGDLVVHRGPGRAWESTSQTLHRPLGLSVRPTVSSSSAVEKALAPSPANRSIRGKQRHGKPTLAVDTTRGAAQLVWRVVTAGTRADGTPSRRVTSVNARTGVVVGSEEQVQTVDGQGQTLYGGAVPLRLTPANGAYQLKDPTRGDTYTTDMNNTTDSTLCQLTGRGCTKGELFTSSDTSFGDGTTGNRESAGAGAQYGTNQTWDYYQDVHGRTGIAGDGAGSYNRTHYGQDYVNAFWQDSCFCMTYGDGDGTNYGPLTALDVTGHEMSHGVTSTTAGLTYSGESGGLNESTSDIFGTLVEFFANNGDDPGDYLIGEQFDLKNHRGFRRMDQPSSDGSSADCWYSGVGDLDVHYSSGVGNHFFYLLAEGSGTKTIGGVQHSSTTCDGSTVSGIGRAAAGDIWYRALTVYMTSSTDYHGARTATLNAAADLYGAGSSQYAAVDAAWAAVNVTESNGGSGSVSGPGNGHGNGHGKGGKKKHA